MDQSQFSQYLAVLMLFVLAVAAPGGMIVLSHLLGKRGQRSARLLTARLVPTLDLGTEFFASPEILRQRCAEILRAGQSRIRTSSIA